MKFKILLATCVAAAGLSINAYAQDDVIEISSVIDLARYAAESGNHVRMAPGTYSMADYLTEDMLEEIHEGVDRTHRRPTVRMMEFNGSDNRFDLRGVVLEIETELYPKLPGGGYVRCVFVSGDDNVFEGLTIRNTGPNQGSNGNIVALFGAGNTLEEVKLYVHGSRPYGYGDLLGKGGPGIVGLQKQSGIQIMGSRTTLRRCQVISRAFGHGFYIQGGNDILLEDCYAEGVMRSTNDMLRDTSGPAFDNGFRSVYENRDGRFLITPGYKKSLMEDGFRTYGGAGSVTLRNCVAVNTRAGFEIGAADDAEEKTIVENGIALGCERGYLLGSHVIVRRSRGDIKHGPLLYLRGGRESDIELELTGEGSDYTIHALATIAGTNHRVRLTGWDPGRQSPQVPVMFGFGMPAHAEMASPILPAATDNIHLVNETGAPVIESGETADSTVETNGPHISDEDAKTPPSGNW